VLLDLEVPFWDRKRLAHRPSELRRTATAFTALVATAQRRHDLWTAEWPPPGVDWPRSLRHRPERVRTGLHAVQHARIGRKRTDLVHQPLDPVIVAGPWVAAAGAAVAGGRALVRSLVH
jgi:hypothetical protein